VLGLALVAGVAAAARAAVPSVVPTAAPATRPAATASAPARFPDEKLLAAIPRDAILVYSYQPLEQDRKSGGMTLAGLIQAAGLLGAFGTNQQIPADTVSAVLTLAGLGHAIVLFDVSSKPLGGDSYALEKFSGALVVDSTDREGRLLAVLKQIIDHYFTAATAELSWVGEGPARRQRLRAKNLPEWCGWEWGWVGDLFVFAVGEGAYDRMLGASRGGPRIDQNTLIRLAGKLDGEYDRRRWLIYLSTEALERQLRPVLQQVYDGVIQGMQMGGQREVLFTAGFRGTGFVSKLYLTGADGTWLGYLTRALEPSDPWFRLVPPQAAQHALTYVRVEDAVRCAVEGYLSSRSEKVRGNMVKYYQSGATDAGLADTYAQVFRHLGPRMLFHDWPPHTLNLPFARTILIEHDRSPELRADWDKVLGLWQRLLVLANGPDQGPASQSAWSEKLFQLQLSRTEDGIWLLHLGPLVLTAGKLTDDYLVLSWSAPAVRAYLAYLATVPPPATQSTAPATGGAPAGSVPPAPAASPPR